MSEFGPIWEELKEIDAVSSDPMDIELFSKGVRDSPDIDVLRCKLTEVLFLNGVIRQKGDPYNFRSSLDISAYNSDNDRRAAFLKDYINNSAWADIGAGAGGLVERLYRNTKETIAVEPLQKYRETLPVPSLEDINELPESHFEVITLFHVLEHVQNQVEFLSTLKSKMHKHRGRMIIEVPHARDSLIHMSKNFKSFTFWSDHLVLHTRQSLQKILKATGFKHVDFLNVQRYGVGNHMKWLNILSYNEMPLLERIFNSEAMFETDRLYKQKLCDLGVSDTIIAIGYR